VSFILVYHFDIQSTFKIILSMGNMPKKVQNVKVSDTTGDAIQTKAHTKK